VAIPAAPPTRPALGAACSQGGTDVPRGHAGYQMSGDIAGQQKLTFFAEIKRNKERDETTTAAAHKDRSRRCCRCTTAHLG
jgi:hypothetical protein